MSFSSQVRCPVFPPTLSVLNLVYFLATWGGFIILLKYNDLSLESLIEDTRSLCHCPQEGGRATPVALESHGKVVL